MEYRTYKIIDRGNYDSATAIHRDTPARTTAGADDFDSCICVSRFTGDTDDSRAADEFEKWAQQNGVTLSESFSANWHYNGESAVSVIRN